MSGWSAPGSRRFAAGDARSDCRPAGSERSLNANLRSAMVYPALLIAAALSSVCCSSNMCCRNSCRSLSRPAHGCRRRRALMTLGAVVGTAGPWLLAALPWRC